MSMYELKTRSTVYMWGAVADWSMRDCERIRVNSRLRIASEA